MAFKMKGMNFGKGTGSALKKDKKFKDTKTHIGVDKGAVVVTKGARTNVGDEGGNKGAVAAERGKRKTYQTVHGKPGKKTVYKEVLTKRKGDASGAETWKLKKKKFITEKKALRQAERAVKQKIRQSKRLNK
jgi:hypothetical protein